MQLKDREINAIACKIHDSIIEVQNKQYEQMYEEYKNSPQATMLFTTLIDFIEKVKKAAEDTPKGLRPETVIFNDFYVRLNEHSDEDCEDLIRHNFRKEHKAIPIPFNDIQREVILAAIDDKSVDSMIDRITEYFSKKRLIE